MRLYFVKKSEIKTTRRVSTEKKALGRRHQVSEKPFYYNYAYAIYCLARIHNDRCKTM